MRKERKNRLFVSIFFPVLFVSLIWGIKFYEVSHNIKLVNLGILPRSIEGLQGILFTPLIHSTWNHLINNTLPLLLLGSAIFYFYRDIAFKIVFWVYFMTGLWVWASARGDSYHIGASGLIYGFASFLFVSGIIRKIRKLLALSMLVIFLYGGMVWGIFPIKYGISYESHLWGAVAGIFLAIYYRHLGPPRKRYSWDFEDENDTEDIEDVPPNIGAQSIDDRY